MFDAHDRPPGNGRAGTAGPSGAPAATMPARAPDPGANGGYGPASGGDGARNGGMPAPDRPATTAARGAPPAAASASPAFSPPLAPGTGPAAWSPGTTASAPGPGAARPEPLPGPAPRPLAPLTGSAAAMPAVVLAGVRKQFDDVVAIDGITLDVPRGAILGIIGPSGSGKTTTIRTVTGGIRPDGGTVRVLGEDPRRFRQRTRERIGYMPQQFLLYPDLTAGENVDFVGALFGMLWRRRRRRVREALQLVELWEARKRRASRLSGGMQRRLELACALVHEPELLLLDEPTAGIDPILRRTIWEEFRRLRDAGRSLLVTTQYVGEAEHCDRVALIATGHLVAYGSPEQLRRQALGGEMLRIETRDPIDARALASIPEVISVRQLGPRELLVVAANAGTAAPRVVDLVGSLGGDVVSSREERPTFDEIFATLVAAHEHALAQRPGGGPATAGRWR